VLEDLSTESTYQLTNKQVLHFRRFRTGASVLQRVFFQQLLIETNKSKLKTITNEESVALVWATLCVVCQARNTHNCCRLMQKQMAGYFPASHTTMRPLRASLVELC